MLKKLTTVGSIILLLCLFIGLSGCISSLEKYQNIAITELDEYAENKGWHNYEPNNWRLIRNHVASGIANIFAAEAIAAVKVALQDSKELINEVEPMRIIHFRQVFPFRGYFPATNFAGTEKITAIFRSSEELISFFENYEVSWSIPIWEEFDNNFFEEQALLLFIFHDAGLLGSQTLIMNRDLRVGSERVALNLRMNSHNNSIGLVATIMLTVDNKDIGNIELFIINFI